MSAVVIPNFDDPANRKYWSPIVVRASLKAKTAGLYFPVSGLKNGPGYDYSGKRKHGSLVGFTTADTGILTSTGLVATGSAYIEIPITATSLSAVSKGLTFYGVAVLTTNNSTLIGNFRGSGLESVNLGRRASADFNFLAIGSNTTSYSRTLSSDVFTGTGPEFIAGSVTPSFDGGGVFLNATVRLFRRKPASTMTKNFTDITMPVVPGGAFNLRIGSDRNGAYDDTIKVLCAGVINEGIATTALMDEVFSDTAAFIQTHMGINIG